MIRFPFMINLIISGKLQWIVELIVLIRNRLSYCVLKESFDKFFYISFTMIFFSLSLVKKNIWYWNQKPLSHIFRIPNTISYHIRLISVSVCNAARKHLPGQRTTHQNTTTNSGSGFKGVYFFEAFSYCTTLTRFSSQNLKTANNTKKN